MLLWDWSWEHGGNGDHTGLWVYPMHGAAAWAGSDTGEIPVPRMRDNAGARPWRWGIPTTKDLQGWPGSPQSDGTDGLISFIFSGAEFLCISWGWRGLAPPDLSW